MADLLDHDADRGAWWVAVLAVVVGTALRITEVAQGHSFGFDDTMLAINIVTRSAAQLARPLVFEQTAPILFLWIDRFLVDLFGVNGVVLRLVPLVASIAVLPLAWVVGRRLVPAPAAALAVALLAISPLTVDFTDRTKPYIVDAAAALTLIALTLWVLREPGRPRAWAALTVAGALAIGLSTPAPFTLAACAAILAIEPATRRRSAAWLFVWVVVAAANYLMFLKPAAADPYLQRFWAGTFFTPGAPDLVARVRLVASAYVENLFFGTSIRPWIAARIVMALLIVVGVVRAWRERNTRALVLLAGPLALAVFAATTHAYPPSNRTWLFTAPSLALFAASGLATLCGRLSLRLRQPVFIAAGIVALLLPARQSWLALRASLRTDNLALAIRSWRALARPGEPIYIFARDAIRWTYYTTDWTKPDTARLHWLMAAAHTIGPNSGNAPSRGHPVYHEGGDLVYTGGGRPEVIGVATGMEDGIASQSEPKPDSGWADNEAERVAAAAADSGDGIWLFFLYTSPATDSTLVAATERRGARLTTARRFDSVRLYHLQFNWQPAGSDGGTHPGSL